MKEGILMRKSLHMPFKNIQDITVSQGIFRKIVSIGDVIVVSADNVHDVKFIDIHYPEYIQELIFNEISKDYEISNHDNPRNNFRNYDYMNHLSQENYYQRPIKINDKKYDDLNLDDFNNAQTKQGNNDYYNKNMINQKNNPKWYFNEKSSHNRNFPSENNYPYKNHDDEFHLKNNRKYKKNNKIGKNHDESLSVIDIYSKKFKKRE
jgi:hypothetical protein